MEVSEAGQFPSLLDITLDYIATGLDTQRFTAVDLTKAYLARIEEVDNIFHAVLEVNKDAISIAAALDEEMKVTGRRGPLHGVPLLIKDNIVTDDSMEATAGSMVLLGSKPSGECSTITKLRQAGVVILGKTNLSEWSNFRSANPRSAWSPRGGQTMGPYYPNSDPSRSSSGSAVAAALGLSFAALGSDTSGSLVSPAQVNNLVGLRPSSGLVACDRCIPISRRQDVVGPMARTVKDTAIIFNAMAGKSEEDPLTWKIPFDPMPDYSQFSDGNLSVKIGVPRNTFSNVPSPVMKAFENALVVLQRLGASVMMETNFPSTEEYERTEGADRFADSFVIASELKADLTSYLASLKTNPHKLSSIADIIDFTTKCPEEGYPEHDIDEFLWIQADEVDINGEKYKSARTREELICGTQGILGTMDEFQLDIIAFPCGARTPQVYAAKLGLPVISVPLGFYPEDEEVKMNSRNTVKSAPGMPFGIMFTGKAFSEKTLLEVAYAFEQATRVRAEGPSPYLTPTMDLRDVRLREEGEMGA